MTIDVLDKSKVIGHIDTRVEITVQDIDDIMCAALEGGITYWCYEAYPYGYNDGAKWPEGVDYTSQCLSRGYDIALVDSEEDDEHGVPVQYMLTLSAMIRGIQMFCDIHHKHYNIISEDYDSLDADCMVQYALFGKLVYG
jgi:hypothetical protein